MIQHVMEKSSASRESLGKINRSPHPTEKWGRITLVFLLGVIVWGGFVRASGSGAGCGSHWPLCNGQVIPIAPNSKTLVEFAHRLTSGASLILCGILLASAFRHFSRRSWTRRAALISFIFILLEALLGAGLVLLELVAENKSLLRTVSLGIHLLNTFLLLGAIALTVRWARQESRAQVRLRWGGTLFQAIYSLALVLGILLLGASGAMTALGDTLFPAQTLTQGIQSDFSHTSHFLIQLRILHPFFAVLISALGIFGLAQFRKLPLPNRAEISFFCTITAGLLIAQLLLGLLNVLLLAPVGIQLAHLLLADLIWIFLILSLASVWTEASPISRSPF